MEEIRKDVEGDILYREVDFEVNLTGSFGVTSLQGEEEFKDLINRADSALYSAKEEGGNRTVVLCREL